jgi:hypothetical protein
MRIERLKMGVRVRVILNRTEAREAGLAALVASGKLAKDHHERPRAAKIYVGGIGRGEGDLHVNPADLEREAVKVAARQIAVPGEANFRVGLDEKGEIAGATFQWFEGADKGAAELIAD